MVTWVEMLNAAAGKPESKGGLNLGPIKEILALNGVSTEGSSQVLRQALDALLKSGSVKISPTETLRSGPAPVSAPAPRTQYREPPQPRTAAPMTRAATAAAAKPVARRPKKVTYKTLDNGGEPFSVELDGDTAHVSTQDPVDPEKYNHVGDLQFQQAFIGKSPASPMTISAETVDQFNGNSILLHTEGNEYIFIGHVISQFTTDSPIVTYMSHVGNNLVPYPYAIDQRGRYWLMTEKVMMKKVPAKYADDPYTYYYGHDGPVSSASNNVVFQMEPLPL